MIGEILALAGALLTLLAAIGVVRFRDVLERMHAVTKASTVGLLFVLAGTAFAVPAADITTLVLAGMSQMVTMPEVRPTSTIVPPWRASSAGGMRNTARPSAFATC